jgi:hypothetical protein
VVKKIRTQTKNLEEHQHKAKEAANIIEQRIQLKIVIVAKITTLDKCVTKKRLTRQISMQ